MIGSISVTTLASGNATFSQTISTDDLRGQALSATATDPGGNTSEFAVDITIADGAGTRTTVASATNPSVYGGPVTFKATVAKIYSGGGTPTGTVEFFDGATDLGTGVLSSSGVATLSTSALGVGTHSITASYSGDAYFSASTSAILNQVVNQASTTSDLTSSSSTAVYRPGGDLHRGRQPGGAGHRHPHRDRRRSRTDRPPWGLET